MVFDKAAATLLHPIILPVPDARTKGVDLTPAIFGNPLVGLTAEETPGRNLSTTTPDIQRQLINRAAEILPALVDMPITATYAGLRPATGFKEYRIHHDPARHWVTVGGIRSTGLSASLGSLGMSRLCCPCPPARPPPSRPPKCPVSRNTCPVIGRPPTGARSSATAKWSPGARLMPSCPVPSHPEIWVASGGGPAVPWDAVKSSTAWAHLRKSPADG